jgi:predicted RecB family nuclease
MTTRCDVSSVPMQGGYVAKRCPVRTQNDVLRPAEPLPVSSILERRFEHGRLFEAEIVADLLRLHASAVAVEGDDSAEVESATSRAMADRVPLILGGRLPVDPIGRRVGEPDLLVAAAGGGYRAIDVKHHASLEAAKSERGLAALCSELDRPAFEDAEIDDAFHGHKRKEDLLQLAHYQRMLEAAGLADAGGRYGAIIGVERRVVWYDLDAPIWRTPSSSGKQKLRTTMEIYDFEFDFRLDIIAVAKQHLVDASVELLVVPVRVAECEECPWWDHCRRPLEDGAGDVSLLPRIGWRERKIHHDHGVADRAALASLDVATAELVASGIDVADLMEQANGYSPNSPVAELPTIRGRKAQLGKIQAMGISTVADMMRLSQTTAAYSGSGLSSLPEQIDRARAALGPDPVYRRREVDAVSVPRADIEVDIDMENVEDGVYLWGALLTDRSTASPSDERYRSFVTWDPLTLEVEVQNFLGFWSWLTGLRAASLADGGTFRAYCYNASAENAHLRSLGRAGGVIDEVEEFIASESWVDMLRVFDCQLITGRGSGLKAVAPLAGFAWSVENAGGAESMLRYDVAMGSAFEAERNGARRWLLTYNRGDVEATLALREWLDMASGSIASIESLEPARP